MHICNYAGLFAMLAQLRVIIACTYIVRYHEASSVTKFSKNIFHYEETSSFQQIICDYQGVL